MSLAKTIKQEAHRLGFQLVGVTAPDPPPHYSIFENWLQEGRHGQMNYLATEHSRQRRANPRLILPECKSILMLGVRYAAPAEAAKSMSAGNPSGLVASYAWGEDYHAVLTERLQTLAAFIQSHAGKVVHFCRYTDSGPLLERDLAQNAGLGWIGKNSCLIHPRIGSFLFLAAILLDIDLEKDQSFAHDYCGKCTRCLDACPTSCILPDRTLDARRCISYLTIELKGAIPTALRPSIGAWVFGCDVCQQVCPWNQRFADIHGDPAFNPRLGVPVPNLLTEISLSPQDFDGKFNNNPVKRAKRCGYLRNIAVALGNAATEDNIIKPDAVIALGQTLSTEPDPLVRGHAAWALGRIGGHQARQELTQAAQNETDTYALTEIQAAIDHA